MLCWQALKTIVKPREVDSSSRAEQKGGAWLNIQIIDSSPAPAGGAVARDCNYEQLPPIMVGSIAPITNIFLKFSSNFR